MLWTLLVVPPALLLFFWWSWRKRRSLLTQFIQARLLPTLTTGISPARQKIRLGCIVLAVVCLILTLARPRWGFDWEDVKLRGLDIVVAIDTSKSMTAEDIAPNRLARAKLAALDLTRLAKADRLGLVAFAGGAFLQCPLTIDDAAFRQSVESLDVNTIPQGGTALADAIETSLTAFKEGDNHKILVLMTDGEDHDSGALKAAEHAAKEGLHIYTIGIGTPEGEVLRVKDAQGKTDYVRDEQGHVVKSHLNEELLRQIAGATEGGFYLPLRGAKTIETLYQDGLARLPKSQHQEKRIKQYHERYHWPLAAAILLLLFEMVLPERKRERKAHAAPAPLRPAARAAALLLFLAVSAGVGRASPASALKEYQKGNYPQALREYEKLLEREKDDPRLHFNAGAAAYRSRNFDEATKQFDAATATPDLQLQQRALFNRGNSLFHLGETTADPKQKTDQWERSLKDFEIASKLNQKDADAKFNHDFVQRKLEELKQQQQQQQQNDKNNKDDKQNQDQQNQQNQNGDQSKKDDQKQQDQKKQDQAQQNKSDQKQQDSQPDKSGQQQKEDQQKQASRQKQDQQKQQQQKPEPASQGQDQKDSSDEQQQEAQAAAAGQMTPQQARQLLEAQKGDEQLMPAKPNGKPTNTSRPLKDW